MKPKTKIDKFVTITTELLDYGEPRIKAVHILDCGHPRITICKFIDDDKAKIGYIIDTKTGITSFDKGILQLSVEIAENFDAFYNVEIEL